LTLPSLTDHPFSVRLANTQLTAALHCSATSADTLFLTIFSLNLSKRQFSQKAVSAPVL